MKKEGGREQRIVREFKSGKSVKVLLTACSPCLSLLCAVSSAFIVCAASGDQRCDVVMSFEHM